jgi:hypothetical protein
MQAKSAGATGVGVTSQQGGKAPAVGQGAHGQGSARPTTQPGKQVTKQAAAKQAAPASSSDSDISSSDRSSSDDSGSSDS